MKSNRTSHQYQQYTTMKPSPDLCHTISVHQHYLFICLWILHPDLFGYFCNPQKSHQMHLAILLMINTVLVYYNTSEVFVSTANSSNDRLYYGKMDHMNCMSGNKSNPDGYKRSLLLITLGYEMLRKTQWKEQSNSHSPKIGDWHMINRYFKGVKYSSNM